MFRRIFFIGLLAGLIAGLFTTGLQTAWSVPLIHAAEKYEDSRPAQPAAHDHAQPGHAQAAPAAGAHAHGDAAFWEPADGFERLAWTAISNVLLGVGAALMLAAAFALFDVQATWRVGALWGAAGFIVCSLAPAVGLPPELPGMATTPVEGRQAWWAFTALSTAAALALVWLPTAKAWKLAALALVLLPHLIGAPVEHGHEFAVPKALIGEFYFASLVTAAVFWFGIGAAVGGLFQRFEPLADDSGLAAAT